MSKKECACYDERDCKTILLTPEEIDSITTRLARAIEETYKDSPKQLVLVVILNYVISKLVVFRKKQ